MDPLGTAAEVAGRLRVPVATLTRWRYVGDGPPFFRVGRHVRYKWADVEAWLQKQKAPERETTLQLVHGGRSRRGAS